MSKEKENILMIVMVLFSMIIRVLFSFLGTGLGVVASLLWDLFHRSEFGIFYFGILAVPAGILICLNISDNLYGYLKKEIIVRETVAIIVIIILLFLFDRDILNFPEEWILFLFPPIAAILSDLPFNRYSKYLKKEEAGSKPST